MPWNENLVTGITEIDRQHQRLVDAINELHAAMAAKKGQQILTGIIARLKDYARTHFTSEERLMQVHAFPESGPHRVEHDKFIEKILDFELEIQESRTLLSLQVLNFLRGWLEGHIKASDMRLGQYLVGRGVR